MHLHLLLIFLKSILCPDSIIKITNKVSIFRDTATCVLERSFTDDQKSMSNTDGQQRYMFEVKT